MTINSDQVPVGKEDNELVSKIHAIRQRGKQMGLLDEEILSLFSMHKKKHSFFQLWILKIKILIRQSFINRVCKIRTRYRYTIISSLLVLLIALTLARFVPKLKEYAYEIFVEERCLVSKSVVFTELLRPRVPCGICRNISKFPTVHNISKESFLQKYAYTGVPVLVKGAITDWGALSSFSYKYLRDLYINTYGALDYVVENCQFLSYKTEFRTLADVFEMSDDRAALKQGTEPWYVGWSNCDSTQSEVGKILRTQYNRPFFLPDNSKTMDADWIFMGGPGNGANLHIDDVDNPSWQAQVSGIKSWILMPSPECEDVCKTLEVTVEKGDIIVLNTNIWYHETLVNHGDISITIGAEYD